VHTTNKNGEQKNSVNRLLLIRKQR